MTKEEIDELIQQTKAESLNEEVVKESDLETLQKQSYAKGWNACNKHWIQNLNEYCQEPILDKHEPESEVQNMTIIINYTNAGVQKAEVIENITGVIKNDNGFLVVKGNDTKRYDENTITSFCILRGVKDE